MASHHEAWGGACVVGECTPEDDVHQFYAVYVYAHLSLTDRTYSRDTTERHFTLQSTLSRHHNSRAWRCRGVSGNLNPAASRRFLMVLCDNRCNMCPDFFPECCSGDLHWSYNASILTRLCITRSSRNWSTGRGSVPQTTAESSTHHRYISL